MTKKDYELIAKAIKGMCLGDAERLTVTAELGVVFARDNPRFNYDRFKSACGVKK